MEYGNRKLNISDLVMNEGQIEGLPRNPRQWTKDDLNRLRKSIRETPELLDARPLLCVPHDGKYIVLGGNMRLSACKAEKMKEVPCYVYREDTPIEKLKEIVIKDNASFGDWDTDALANEWSDVPLDEWGATDWKDESESGMSGSGLTITNEAKGALADRFLMPPFSVLNSNSGAWQSRKKLWLDLGIASEEGRGENLTFSKTSQPPAYYNAKNVLRESLEREPTTEEVFEYCEVHGIKLSKGTSIFDPVLCELSYKWFNVPGGLVIDPFAGGGVRGIVASTIGMDYRGVDLRAEQVEANRVQAEVICAGNDKMPQWFCSDSRNIDLVLNGTEADMIFSCPPYADLEVYSNDPNDLSNMEYSEFLSTYREIIAKSCSLLKDNRFAVFVVGEVRDKKTSGYYNFVSDTIQAFRDAGLIYYNEMILYTAISSLAIRAGKPFSKTRKIGKCHQNILVFYKGGGEI